MSKKIKVGIIGAGLAGQAHAFGYRNAMMSVSNDIDIELTTIADPNLALAQKVAARYGFNNAIASVDDLLASDVDVISLALPNFLHDEILSKTLESGKHVFAEKPIGRTPAESKKLRAIAEKSTAVTGVGFSFRRLPGLAALAQAVREGLVGEVHTARAWYFADYAADPNGALSWRFSQEEAGAGALLDIGAHAIDALQFVAGDVKRVVSATLKTVIAERPKPVAGGVGHGAKVSEERGPVTNDDIALLNLELTNGAAAQVSLSRIAHGIPNSLGVEVHGTKGSTSFDSISAGEFHVFQADPANPVFNGPRRIFTGPQHPYFTDVAAMPGAGVGTGYAEAFTAEIQEFLVAVKNGTKMDTDFATADSMMAVVGAAQESATKDAPVEIAN